jgi:putative sigma-54 modulation protein
MTAAISEALEHLEKQAVKYKTRWRTKKRRNHKSPNPKSQSTVAGKWNGEASQEKIGVALGLSEATSVDVVVHKFPAVARTTEVHLVRSEEAVAMRPMTLEEAIKEAHFRDRDVFVFRDPKGKVMILHRTRDGKMELIEAP